MTNSGRVVETRLRRLFDESITQAEKETSAKENGDWPALTEEVIREKFLDRALELIDEVFLPDAHVRPSEKKRLVSLLVKGCLKVFPVSEGSGVVIAGYGEREAFPSVYPIRLDGRICGVLRIVRDDPIVIDHDSSGAFKTFAQDEMAIQFVTGINNRTRQEVITYWQKWAVASSREIISRIRKTNRRLGSKTIASIRKEYKKIADEGFHDFLQHMNDHQRDTFVAPLTRSIGFLPKEELAHMAETLVNLTSVVQRFSVHQDETVGGEIDVALISRGDGLIWMKRKHYFSLDLNPAWPNTHMATTPSAFPQTRRGE